MIPFILQGDNIVLFIDNKPEIINSSHLNYLDVKNAILTEAWDTIKDLISVKSAIVKFSEGKVSILDDVVCYNGVPVHNALATRILKMFNEGFPIKHFCKFMENLELNPSYRARTELYGFLEACNLPITDDGCFLAYKKIRSDWTDTRTGTFDNSIGSTPSMPRRNVNENPNDTCSVGLHVCSYSYLEYFGGQRIISVKVNPADVVSVPIDYNNAKMRTCKYEVLKELDFDESQKNDVLSKGSVVHESTKKSIESIEVDLLELSNIQIKILCDILGVPGSDSSHRRDELVPYILSLYELKAIISALRSVSRYNLS